MSSLASLESIFSNINHNIPISDSLIKTVPSMINNSNNKVITISSKLCSQEDDIMTLQSTVSGHTTSISSQESDISALQTTVNNGSTGVAALNTSLGTLQSTMSGNTTSIESNSSAITDLQSGKNLYLGGVGLNTINLSDTKSTYVLSPSSGFNIILENISSLRTGEHKSVKVLIIGKQQDGTSRWVSLNNYGGTSAVVDFQGNTSNTGFLFSTNGIWYSVPHVSVERHGDQVNFSVVQLDIDFYNVSDNMYTNVVAHYMP